MTDIERVKFECREDDMPFFTDEQLATHLELNNGDVEATIYKCLIIKSEDYSISVSGLSTQDTSKYFKRLASLHRPNNSGVLGGGGW